MPIPLQTPIVEHVGNGVTTVFAYSFAILDSADLKVRVGGVDVATGFTVSGVGNRAGGTVTFSVAPGSGVRVLLRREVSLERETDYQYAGDLREEVLDSDFDRVWMALQDQLVIASRTLRAPVGETFAELPAATSRALKVLGFNASGAPVLLSRTEDGGAALALDLLDADDPAKGAALVGYKGRTVAETLAEVVRVTDYGADATGVADSTVAFNLMDAYLQTVTSRPVSVVIPAGRYKVNPRNTSNPFGGPQARLFGLYSNGSTVEGPGVVVIDNSVSYTAGFTAGEEKYWSVVEAVANNCIVSGLGFDGNGTHTASGYNPAVVNVRWQMAASFGVSGTHRVGNKVIFCHGKDFGGQSVAFQYQDDSVIACNRFDGASGAGVSVGNNALIYGNTFRDSHDAPIYVNGNVFGARITDNYIKGTNNGSGIDVVGAFDVEVSQNHIEGALGSGVLVSWSSQQSVAARRVHIHHNTFKENARFNGSPPVAEVFVGSFATSRPDNATTVHIEHNTFLMDGSLGAFAGQVLRLGHGTHDVSFCDNEIYGTPNANGTVISTSQQLDGLEIRRNKWLGSAARQIIGLGTGLTHSAVRISENRLIGADVAGTIFANSGIEAPDGSIEYGIQRNVGTTAVNIVTITWASGNDHAIIEISATQQSDRGAAIQRIIARGSSGAATVLLENASVASFGASPPVIAADIATNGILRVTVASGTGTNLTSIGVRVRTRVPGPALSFS